MSEARPYQARAIAGIERSWADGKRAPLCVIPTGGGKTFVATEVIDKAACSTLFVVHTRDLLAQSVERLRYAFGASNVDDWHNKHARIKVATIQGLRRSRKQLPDAELVVFDEGHHYAAEDWGTVAEHYAESRLLGLTATPERSDGRPLGDMFDCIVVGATYSELLRDGHLVDCEVIRPSADVQLTGSALACSPLDAYRKHAPNRRAFLFASSVHQAVRWRDEFSGAGISSQMIQATTPKVERATLLRQFAAGSIQVLCNIACLTEGIDVPAAECVILARGCQHVSLFLQIVGRVLRPFPGKQGAMLLDLTSATHRHGMPTADREYSLEGKGIRLTEPGALRTCPQCGYTELAKPLCTGCGFLYPTATRQSPRVYNFALVNANTQQLLTAGGANLEHYNALRARQREQEMGCYWVIAQYKRRHGKTIVVHDATYTEKRDQFLAFDRLRRSKGWKPGYVNLRFKQTFGHYPLGYKCLGQR